MEGINDSLLSALLTWEEGGSVDWEDEEVDWVDEEVDWVDGSVELVDAEVDWVDEEVDWVDGTVDSVDEVVDWVDGGIVVGGYVHLMSRPVWISTAPSLQHRYVTVLLCKKEI